MIEVTIPQVIKIFNTKDITFKNIIDLISLIYKQFPEAEEKDLAMLMKLSDELEAMQRDRKSVYPVKWNIRDFLLTFLKKNS
jgi:hypothetical protein